MRPRVPRAPAITPEFRKFFLHTCICLIVWFTASIFIAFSSKYLLSNVDFHYPFFLAFCTNSGVAIIAFIITRLPKLRQPPIPRRTYLCNVVPLGIATMLDIGFSNWSLMFLQVSMHTILKGSAPLFVLLCGLLLRVEAPSCRTPIAILLIVGGLSLVVCDRLALPDRPLGLLLGVISVSFTGMRWALTQLLMRGSEHAATASSTPAASSASAAGSSDRDESSTESTTARSTSAPSSSSRRADVAPADTHATPEAPRSAPPRKRTTHPLNTMLNTMPVIACGAFVCVLLLERQVFATLGEFAAAGTLAWLLLYILVLWLLVFALVLAEFQLVLLTSSLTVSVFGVIKEIVTVLAAVVAGDHLSAANVLGIALCLLGNLAYFTRRATEQPATPAADKEAPSIALTSADAARPADVSSLEIAVPARVSLEVHEESTTMTSAGGLERESLSPRKSDPAFSRDASGTELAAQAEDADGVVGERV